MANITITFRAREGFGGSYATAHYAYVGYDMLDDDVIKEYYNIVPDSSASASLSLDVRGLPANAVITSCSLSRSVTPAAAGWNMNDWMALKDVPGEGTISERIIDYLNQSPKPTSLAVNVFMSYTARRVSYITDSSRQWTLNNVSISNELKAVELTLDVTYEEVENSTVSYGVNNAYQKCNVYYGTGGEWKKCKAHFGSGGSWVECK